MTALPDDALGELWILFDATGIRPEYLLPVLYYESGFDPSRPNAQGAPYYGVAQTSGSHLTAIGTTPAAFLAMTAAEQIRLAVAPYFRDLAPLGIGSGARAYQANLLPATLATVRGLAQVVAQRGSFAYASNAQLDVFHQGAITLAGLAVVMGRSAASAPVRAAIARAYALRPAAGPPRNPAFGTDYLDAVETAGLLAAAVALWLAQQAR